MYESSDLTFRLVDMSIVYAWRGVQQRISAILRGMMTAVMRGFVTLATVREDVSRATVMAGRCK
jgi:hypothetical protein